MTKTYRPAVWIAAYFVLCALVHVPYTVLLRSGVIERSPAWSLAMAVLGMSICVAEVVFFAVVLAQKGGSLKLFTKIPIVLVMWIAGYSALVRIANIAAGYDFELFNTFWKTHRALLGDTVPTINSMLAVPVLCWLGMSFDRGSLARVAAVLAAYETLFTLVLWGVVANHVSIPTGVYYFNLVQYYVLWALFYGSMACYKCKQ